MREAIAGYVQQVGRGLAYVIILQLSVGTAGRLIMVRAVGTTSTLLSVSLSILIVVAVAGILVNSSNPPSYWLLTRFSLVSLLVGFVADTLVGVGDGHVGALYPTLQAVLVWLGAFLLAYAVVFEVTWKQDTGSLEETNSD